jgi:hypothetical protein
MYSQVKIFVIGVLAMVSVVVISTNAMAANEPFCHNYAGTAVVQYQQMTNSGKQCQGFRWHNWYNGHYKWCRKVSEQTAQSEAIIRANTIQNWGAC